MALKKEPKNNADSKTTAADGSELIMTMGQAKKELMPLIRANVSLMAPLFKQGRRDISTKDIKKALLDNYRTQLEQTGVVYMTEPIGLVRLSVRKEQKLKEIVVKGVK